MFLFFRLKSISFDYAVRCLGQLPDEFSIGTTRPGVLKAKGGKRKQSITILNAQHVQLYMGVSLPLGDVYVGCTEIAIPEVQNVLVYPGLLCLYDAWRCISRFLPGSGFDLSVSDFQTTARFINSDEKNVNDGWEFRVFFFVCYLFVVYCVYFHQYCFIYERQVLLLAIEKILQKQVAFVDLSRFSDGSKRIYSVFSHATYDKNEGFVRIVSTNVCDFQFDLQSGVYILVGPSNLSSYYDGPRKADLELGYDHTLAIINGTYS